jgi:hypothetical protein
MMGPYKEWGQSSPSEHLASCEKEKPDVSILDFKVTINPALKVSLMKYISETRRKCCQLTSSQKIFRGARC